MNREEAKKEIEIINGGPVTLGEIVYDAENVEIAEWDDIDGDYWGYVRENLAGISVFTCDDFENIAPLNAEIDLSKLTRLRNEFGNNKFNQLIEFCKENNWVF